MSRITLFFLSLLILSVIGDAWSSNIAALSGIGEEFNPIMADGSGGMSTSRYWVINFIMGGFLIAMFEWALRKRHLCGEGYLKNPLTAVFNFLCYINPFSTRNKPRAIIHYLAVIVCFILVKAVATISNLRIAGGHSGILDDTTTWLNQYIEGGLLYTVAITVLILPFWIISIYLVAHFIKAEKVSIDQRLTV